MKSAKFNVDCVLDVCKRTYLEAVPLVYTNSPSVTVIEFPCAVFKEYLIVVSVSNVS